MLITMREEGLAMRNSRVIPLSAKCTCFEFDSKVVMSAKGNRVCEIYKDIYVTVFSVFSVIQKNNALFHRLRSE